MAGEQMYLAQFMLSSYRDPDTFDMYKFNYHYSLGLVEMLQIMILDFKEAADWKAYLVGCMFLSLIVRLERENVLDQALNAGLVIALYIKLAQESRHENLLDEDGKKEKVGDGVKYAIDNFDDYVLAYSKKLGITLKRPKGLGGFVEQCDEVDLPSSTANKNDPWKFANALKQYEKRHTGLPPRGWKSTYRGIGCYSYDIKIWMPEDRKQASFDKKDPIPKSVMNEIKKGGIMQWA
ncbi:hypothetical protein PWT90_08556 [Aphanocladium album]|nr:hypothetical protein PWT90_08556 [Aphanocladium album]